MALHDWVTLGSTGATVCFTGTTRDNFNGKEVLELAYEAYEAMALRCMQQLCTEARARWALGRIALVHRVGVVGVREASVVVAVSSVHRAEAFAAASHLIDRIKATVPVWKSERYRDGSAWKANKECFFAQ